MAGSKLQSDIAAYLRLDDDDPTLAPLIDAALAYVERATGIPYAERKNDPVYLLAVKMAVAHWFDNRGAMAENSRDIPFALQTMLDHIKLCGDYRGSN